MAQIVGGIGDSHTTAIGFAADRDLILQSDWRGLIQRGATFFVLEKLAVVTGAGNLDVYSGMKGKVTRSRQSHDSGRLPFRYAFPARKTR